MHNRIGLALIVLLGLTGCVQQEDGTRALAWWAWLLIILFIAVAFWIIFRPKAKESTPTSEYVPTKTAPIVEPVEIEPVLDTVSVGQAAESSAPVIEEPPVEPTPFEPDDLKIIEGIGPKINSILHEAGVLTFKQLAEMDPERIMGILTVAGIRLADTTTWPEQASLAANGEWDALRAYQDSLKGGRIV